jgi:hypothetical protein
MKIILANYRKRVTQNQSDTRYVHIIQEDNNERFIFVSRLYSAKKLEDSKPTPRKDSK